MPWYKFSSQIIIMIAIFIASSILAYKGGFYNYITAFWGYFQFMLLTPIFILNKVPKESSMDFPVFKDY